MALRTPAFNDAKTYGFEWLRAIVEAGDVQEGVVGAGDFKVTAAGAGGMRVDVAAGGVFVKGDSGIAGTGLSQGLFYITNDALVANAVTLAASDPTNPRVDQIVVRVRDSSDLGSGADDAVLEVVQGAAAAGATLDNRSGAAALPNDRVRLADVLVPAASVAVTAGNVRDRRPWARGAQRIITKASGNSSTTSGTLALIDATNVAPRIECSGAPIRLSLRGVWSHSVANGVARWQFFQDGAGVGPQFDTLGNPTAGNGVAELPLAWELTPAAGSHIFAPAYAVITAGTVTQQSSGNPLNFCVEELVRQNADNS